MLSVTVCETRESKENIAIIRNSINSAKVVSASIALGEELTRDLVRNVGLNQKDPVTVLVKYRDGVFAAIGLKKVLPESKLTYIETRRCGPSNERVEVHPMTTQGVRLSEPYLVLDPMVARGGTMKELIVFADKLSDQQANVSMINFITSKPGLLTIQRTIDDYVVEAYLETAELHPEVNEKGWIIPGLSFIKDYGDKLFGTWGHDQPISELADGVKSLLWEPAGDIEAARATALFLLLRLKWGSSRPYAFRPKATYTWIAHAFRYSEIFSGKQLIHDWRNTGRYYYSYDLRQILHNLVAEGFLEEQKLDFRTFALTKDGEMYLRNIYLPAIAESPYSEVFRTVIDETEFLTGKKTRAIFTAIKKRKAQVAL